MPVIRGLTFKLTQGSALAIIGPNGAGKSVLARALIGVLPYTGHLCWSDKTQIGYVPQKLDIDRDLPITGYNFLRAKAAVLRAPRADLRSMLELVGLRSEAADKPVGALSGGQFQRLLVAAALIGRPTVLMLDEPTAGVDEPGQESLNHTIERLRCERGLTVVFISHELNVVFQYATNVLCLSRSHSCFGVPRTILEPQLLRELFGTGIGYHIHDDARP